MPQILQVAAVTLATLGTGAATMSVMNGDVADLAVPAGTWSAAPLLDGLSFDIVGKDLDSGYESDDVLLFRDGMFQSVDCEEYCAFGWTEYQTKVIDDVVHFTASPICADAPHTVVWYGTVTGDDIEVAGTWTTRRWYWTHQIRFEATGSVKAPAYETAFDNDAGTQSGIRSVSDTAAN